MDAVELQDAESVSLSDAFGASEGLAASPTYTSPTLTPPLSNGTPVGVDSNGEEMASLVSRLTTAAPPDEKEERPSLSYKDLIIEAIESSPEKRLKLSEIYQVIRYLHPYYRRRQDQWGWQNSIRHNLSLHDCFIKLPLKQTSASGVVGHFWTVSRESEENRTGSSRKRSRNGSRIQRCASGKVASSNPKTKGKGRQSVSSDSGIMSDESSQANSPSVLLLSDGGFLSRKDAVPLSNVASAPQLHRPVPSYGPVELQKSTLQPPTSSANLLMSLAGASSAVNPHFPSTPMDTSALLSSFPEIMSGNNTLLSRLALGTLQEETSNFPASSLGLLETPSPNDQLQRLRLLNLFMYQNELLQRIGSQQQQQVQALSSMLLNQLASKNVQVLASPAQPPLNAPLPIGENAELSQQFLSLLGQQLGEGNSLLLNSDNSNSSEPPVSDSSKDNLVAI